MQFSRLAGIIRAFARGKADASGLAAARAQGRIGGRRPRLSPEQWAQAERLLAAGETRQRVALLFDVGISTLYKKFPASQPG